MMSVDPKIVKAMAKVCSKDLSRYALTALKVEDHGDGKGRFVATDGKILAKVDFKHFDPRDFPEADEVKVALVGAMAIEKTGPATVLVNGEDVAGLVGKASFAKRATIPVLGMPVIVIAKPSGQRVIDKSGQPVLDKDGKEQYEEGAISSGLRVIGTDLERTSSVVVRATEGSYPNYEDVFPDESDKIGDFDFDPHQLIKMCEVTIAINPTSPILNFSFIKPKINREGNPVDQPMVLRAKNKSADVEMKALIMPMCKV